MTRLHFLACIQAARLAGFTHYAAALLELYWIEFPPDLPERAASIPRISHDS